MYEILDPAGRTWAEFMRLDPVDQAVLGGHLTPHAFRALFCTDTSFEHLYLASDQIFSNLPIFTLTACGFNPIKCPTRARYAYCFHLIQNMIMHNKRLVGVSDLTEFVNMSISFSKDTNGKIAGYTTYMRYTDPVTIGDELVFAFYHKLMRKVVLVAVPEQEHKSAALQFICGNGIVLPFEKVCGWCGRTAEDLKKCSKCKGSRYCNSDCQMLHWGLHKHECSAAE